MEKNHCELAGGRSVCGVHSQKRALWKKVVRGIVRASIQRRRQRWGEGNARRTLFPTAESPSAGAGVVCPRAQRGLSRGRGEEKLNEGPTRRRRVQSPTRWGSARAHGHQLPLLRQCIPGCYLIKAPESCERVPPPDTALFSANDMCVSVCVSAATYVETASGT